MYCLVIVSNFRAEHNITTMNRKSKAPRKNSKAASVGKRKPKPTKKLKSEPEKNSYELQRCKNWLITQNSEHLSDQRVEDIETELSSDSGNSKLELVVSLKSTLKIRNYIIINGKFHFSRRKPQNNAANMPTSSTK